MGMMGDIEFGYEQRSCPNCGTKYLVPLDAYEADQRMLEYIHELGADCDRYRERIEELEALIRWVNGRWEFMKSGDEWEFEERMAELGIEEE